VANTSYLLANDAQTIVTLPDSPNTGDVVTVSGLGAGQSILSANWTAQNSGDVF
jgi:hypothetical protein